MDIAEPLAPLLCVREGAEGEILALKLNRPRVLNAINWEILEELDSALEEAERDESLRCLLMEGAGDRAFSTGADLRVVATLTPGMARDWVRLGHRICNRLVCSRLPSIAAVRGHTLGGGLELALACDFRVAAESVQLGLPEIKRGWLPGWGGIRRLCCMLGPARARPLALLGESMNAEDALMSGLVQQVATDGRLAAVARELAQRLALLSPANARQAKAQLITPELLIEEATVEADGDLLAEAVATQAFQEATLRYREK